MPSTPENVHVSSCLVGMSGGVDSSVAALLLVRSQVPTTGATLRLASSHAPGDSTSRHEALASLPRDALDARSVCDVLGIDHLYVDASSVFDELVVSTFVKTYVSGQTPNPCVICNRLVKFPMLADAARSRGLSHVATGHYARISHDRDSGRWQLLRARDERKDQSYMLYGLSQDLLSHTLLPLGELTKDETRDLAQEAGLPVANRPESQDVCFIPAGDYEAFLERRTGRRPAPGEIRDVSGHVLGRHDGLWRYTVGQRRGIGIAAAAPLYVVEKDCTHNVLVVGTRDQTAVRACRLENLNWVSIVQPEEPLDVYVKTRYRQSPVAASITPPSSNDGSWWVTFAAPLDGVAPGQACVLYRGDLVLGGGTIVQTRR